jgi:hypothetical protein
VSIRQALPNLQEAWGSKGVTLYTTVALHPDNGALVWRVEVKDVLFKFDGNLAKNQRNAATLEIVYGNPGEHIASILARVAEMFVP